MIAALAIGSTLIDLKLQRKKEKADNREHSSISSARHVALKIRGKIDLSIGVTCHLCGP